MNKHISYKVYKQLVGDGANVTNWVKFNWLSNDEPFNAVDLGTLNWGVNQGVWYSPSLTGIAKFVNGGNLIMQANYTNAGYTTITALVDGQYTVRSDGVIYFKDSRYANAAAFKAAMSGVYLYYETA